VFPYAYCVLWIWSLLILSSITYLVGVCVRAFPGAAVMLAELDVEAGLPNNVLNIAYGSNVRLLIIFYHILFTPLIPSLS